MPQTLKKDGQRGGRATGQRGGSATSLALPEQRPMQAPEGWQPLGELEQISERMRRVLEQTFGQFGWPLPAVEATGWSPLVDIEEQDDAYVVEAELPGVKREDVKVEVVGHELTISGELKETERKGVVRKRTRRTGYFHYRVALPESVAAEKVEARLSDGVLSIRIPKIEKASRRQVEIKS
jgi:HSP20 family protein